MTNNGFDIHLTPDELENLADCITVQIHLKSIIEFNVNVLKPLIHNEIEQWFSTALEAPPNEQRGKI